jgi:hypothetical protein
VNRDFRFGGSTLLRTDNDGATWHTVLTFRGGGDGGCTEPGDFDVQIGGLTMDDQGRLYLARNAYAPGAVLKDDTLITSGVAFSADQGATWSDLASQQSGRITDLELGPDRQSLFAATDQGLYRLALPLAGTK